MCSNKTHGKDDENMVNFLCPKINPQCKVEKGRFHLKIKELCTVIILGH